MSRKALLIGAAAWAVISAFGFYKGCYSATLPPAPPPEVLAKVRETHFPATVGVETYKFPVYSERLVKSLRRTGLFDDVQLLDKLPNATLVARVERTIYGTATIPIFTAISLGIVPTTVEEEWGESFFLRRNAPGSPEIAVDFSYKGPTTLGWAAAIRSLSADVSTAEPRNTARFRDAFSASICAQAEGILQLMAAP